MLRILSLIVCILIILTGCGSSSARFTVKRAPVVNLKNNKRLVIVDFQGKSSGHVRIMENNLARSLLNSGYFEAIMDREHLTDVLEEQKLQLSGLANSKNRMKISKITGGAVMVYGDLETDKFTVSKSVSRQIIVITNFYKIDEDVARKGKSYIVNFSYQKTGGQQDDKKTVKTNIQVISAEKKQADKLNKKDKEDKKINTKDKVDNKDKDNKANDKDEVKDKDNKANNKDRSKKLKKDPVKTGGTGNNKDEYRMIITYTTNKIYKVKGTYLAKASFRLVDVETGTLIAVRSHSASKTVQNISTNERSERIDRESLFNICQDQIVRNFTREMLPYYQTISAVFHTDGKLPETDNAVKLIRKGDFDNALPILEKLTKKTGLQPHVLAKAFYNLGLAQMYHGFYTRASKNISAAIDLNPNEPLYRKALLQVNREKKNTEELKASEGN